MTSTQRFHRWLVFAALAIGAPPLTLLHAADTPGVSPLPEDRDDRPSADDQASGGAANIDLNDLPWLSKGLSTDDIRSLLDNRAIENITSLTQLLHRDVPTPGEMAEVRAIWDSVKSDYEAYSRQLASHYAGKSVAGEPVVQDGKLGFILPLDLSAGGEMPMPENLRLAFMRMIKTGRHAGIKSLIDAGVIDHDANKLMGKIRRDIHEAVMAKLVADVGHPVHLDTFSIAEMIRSDIDQTLGAHVAYTWTDNQRQSVGTDGAKLVERYYALFSETVRQVLGGEFAGVKAQDMEIVCHNADARLPDAVLHYEDNSKFTAVMRSGQRKLILNPEAYFLEGAYRAEVERRSFETDQRLHSVYSLHVDAEGKLSVIQDLYTAKEKVYQFLSPELRPAHAADVALGQWVFFRRHMHDASPTTLMDQSKYPLRVVDEAFPLMTGKDLWSFEGFNKLRGGDRRRMLRQAIPNPDRFGMSFNQMETIIDASARLRAAAKAGSGDIDSIMRPFEEQVLRRISEKRKQAGLRETGTNQIRRELGDSIHEMGRVEYQKQAQAFMLNAAVAAAPLRIAEFLNPQVDVERLRAIAERRVQTSDEAVERAAKILGELDEPAMKARYKEFAELDLTQIGLILRHYSPQHYDAFIAKFDPETRQHFEWLLFEDDLATFLREPIKGGAQVLRYSKHRAVEAMRAGWEAFVEKRTALRQYADSVRVTIGEGGARLAAGQVLGDLGNLATGTGRSIRAAAPQAKLYGRWGMSVVAHNFASDWGFSFPDLDKGINKSQYMKSKGQITWGKAKWKASDFLRSNVGLGQIDSVLTVMQTYQQRGEWDEETDSVFWNEIYCNIPGFGAFYSTYKNLNAANVLGLVMQWGPVYAQYAYGEAVAATVAAPLVALTVYNITSKVGQMWSYSVFDSVASELFFGFDPGTPDVGTLLKQVRAPEATGPPADPSVGPAISVARPITDLNDLNAAIEQEANARQDRQRKTQADAVTIVDRHAAALDDGMRRTVQDLLTTVKSGNRQESDEAIRSLLNILSTKTRINDDSSATHLAQALMPPPPLVDPDSGLILDLGPTLNASSVDPSYIEGIPIDPLNPIAPRQIALPAEPRRPGLLDVVPGKTLDERKTGLFEWMETYHHGNAADRPFSVMQSVDIELSSFRQLHRLIPPSDESAEARAHRLTEEAKLQPQIDELQARVFAEKLEFKSKALAVEFLRGDLWDDRVFGPMRTELRSYYEFWLRKPDTLAHLTRLIREHYILGMHKSQFAEAAAENEQRLAEAGAAWAMDATMRQVVSQATAEANAIRSETVWANRAMPEEPHELTPEELDRHLRGDFPGLAGLSSGETTITIVKPDGPVPLSSIDSLGLLQLAASVKTPAQKFKRPFRYEWTLGSSGGKDDPASGLATLTLDNITPGKALPVTVRVFDLLDRPMGEATENIEVAPHPIRFEKVTLTHRDSPDKVLFEAKELDRDLSIAAGHGYRLAVEIKVHEPREGFTLAGIGLIPEAVVDEAQRYLDSPPTSGQTTGELSVVNFESLVPPGYQYLWYHLNERHRGRPSAVSGSAGKVAEQSVVETLSLTREKDAGDDYRLFAIASGAKSGRYFLFAPNKITLRPADAPSIEWESALLKRKGDELPVNLLGFAGVVRPVVTVKKGEEGTVSVTVTGKTGGVRPEVLEVGTLRETESGKFDPSTYKAFATGVRAGAEPGTFTCQGQWNPSGAAVGVYELSARIKIPTPQATFVVSERLEAHSELWPLIGVEPKPTLADDIADLATRATDGDGNQGTGSGPAQTQDSSDDDDASGDDDRGQRPPADGLAEDIREQAAIAAVDPKSRLVLQRLRVDKDVATGVTLFARAMAVKLWPIVNVGNLTAGMKVQYDVGYVSGGARQPKPLIHETAIIDPQQKGVSEFKLDLLNNSALAPLWVGKNIWRGEHVAYLHVTVISPSGRFRSKTETIEVPFRVEEEGLGEAHFEPMIVQDHPRDNVYISGTKFWNDSELLVRSPVEITEVYGPEVITISHRFTVVNPQGTPMTWKVDDKQSVRGGGPHGFQKPLSLKVPLALGAWLVRHEIVSVKDNDGIEVLKPGSQRMTESRFAVVEPKIVMTGPEDGFQIQFPPGDKKGAPVYEFTKPTDVAAARFAFHVQDVPVDCNLRGTLVWTSPDTGKTTARLPAVTNLKEGDGRVYWATYSFKTDDHDGPYTCQVTLEFYRAWRGPRTRLDFKPLQFRFKGRAREGPQLQDITVATRLVKFRIWDNGGMVDDVINAYVDGRRVISGWLMPEEGKDFTLTIPPDRNEVVLTIESVSSKSGPNTAAISFEGAIEVHLRTQGWWIAKPGGKSSCVITYKPPAPPRQVVP